VRSANFPFPQPAAVFVPQQRTAHGIASLPFDESAALRLSGLPPIQATAHQLVILTSDPRINAYGIRTEW